MNYLNKQATIPGRIKGKVFYSCPKHMPSTGNTPQPLYLMFMQLSHQTNINRRNVLEEESRVICVGSE